MQHQDSFMDFSRGPALQCIVAAPRSLRVISYRSSLRSNILSLSFSVLLDFQIMRGFRWQHNKIWRGIGDGW